MSDKLRCNCPYPDCGKMMEYSAWRAGQQFPCPACKREFVFPAAPPPDASVAPAADWTPVPPPPPQPPWPVVAPPQPWQPPAVQPPPVYQPPAPPPQAMWPAPPVPQPPAPVQVPVPARPRPSADRARPRRDVRIEIDRTPSRRKRIRRYFTTDLSYPMMLFGLCLARLFIPDGFALICVPIPLVVGVVILAVQLALIATDAEVTEIVREDRDELVKAALRRVRDVTDAVPADGTLPGWEEPMLFVGPEFLPNDQELIAHQVRVTGGRKLRAARSNVMVVVLGTYQLVTYRIAINHRTGMVYEDTLKEFYYQDVVTADSTTDAVVYATGLTAYLAHNPRLYLFLRAILDPPVRGPAKWVYRLLNPLFVPVAIFSWFVRDARSEVVFDGFAIRAGGDTVSRVSLRFEYVDDAVEHQGALDRADGADELAVRNRIREVKALTRREG